MAWAAVPFMALSCFITCSAPAMAVSEIDSARPRLSVTAASEPPCPRHDLGGVIGGGVVAGAGDLEAGRQARVRRSQVLVG